MLFVFFTAVYFVCFTKIIDLIFKNTLSLFTSILALVCYVIAFVISVGLAEFTIKRIKW